MSGYGDEIIGGMSKYAIRERCTKQRTIFRENYRVKPGKLRIPGAILQWGRLQVRVRGEHIPVMLSPHTKAWKDWGWQHWLDLVPMLPWPLVQCDYGAEILPGVRGIKTPTFQHAAAVLKHCHGLITVEGGMHHAAGAFMKPAVVIMGGTNPPNIMGYTFHANLATYNPETLGLRMNTPEVRETFDAITPEMVAEAAKVLFP